MNSKFSQNKPYQSHHELRNNSSNRERSRSRDLSPRQSYHDYPQGNSGQNNNYNNRNNKPYHYRQNNERQFDTNMNKRDRDNFSFGYNNSNYTPSRDDCLIIFQNNFFNFDSKDFIALKNELKRELKDDIYNIYYNYALYGISDKIFRFTTNPSVNYPCKSKAIKIISDFIFDIMKQQNDKVTYLKLIFVIPENVIGFIIGISGKNINQIRDETNTKIEVYTLNNTKSYRKIEIAGVPQSIADAGAKICEITRKYFNFNNEKILNRNNHSSPQRDQSWGRDKNREQYGMDFRDRNRDRDRDRNDRYHEGHWNKDYDNNGNNKEYRGMYNRERNEFRDMGYRNREGYRNYGGRDMKNYNNNKDNNNFRDFGNRYKNNNYDRGNNNRPYYDNKRNNNDFNNDKDNNDSKNRDNYSNRSFSRKSGSRYSNDNRSYNNNNDNNDGEWGEDKEYKKEEIKNEDLPQEQHSENNLNLEPGEAKDSDIDNNNYINDNNNANNINDKPNESKNNNENDIGVSNIENNNLDSNMNINNLAEKSKNEIDEIHSSILAIDDDENDKLCKIIIYLSSEEINLLNNSKYENDNIWINLEKSSQCSISKITKIIDEKEISLITFNGTPKQNSSAIYRLQKYLLDTKREITVQNKIDN